MYRDFRRRDKNELLAEFTAREAISGFINFVRELEKLFDHRFVRNQRGFPAGPSSMEGPEDDILRFYSRALVCSLEECDEEHEDDPNASPYRGCFDLLCKCPSNL